MSAAHVVGRIDPLDRVKSRILEGYERTKRGRKDWIEGTLEIAAAMHDGRFRIPDNITFGEWLKKNDLDLFSHQDRAALLKFGEHPDVARAVLEATTHSSYQHIYDEARGRFTQASKTATSRGPAKRKRKASAAKRKTLRAMKLGDETVAKLAGTSLERAEEQDELVVLNRGAREGELMPEVEKLVADATAGKIVSALAVTDALRGNDRPKLIDAFVKRMAHAWAGANHAEAEAFIEYLMSLLTEKPR